MGLTCCHLRIKLLTGEELLFMDVQGKWFLEMESPPCEDGWNGNKGFRILQKLS